MHSLDEFATAKLTELESNQLRRSLVDSTRVGGIWVERDGKRLLSFSCNDYLNLSQHPAVIEAAIAATRQHGVGSGASRLVTGNYPLLGELEARLAALKGTEAACVFGSGYLANAGIIPVLAGRGDLVLIDELAHACLFAGTQLTRGASHIFRHNDVAHVEELLTAHRANYKRVLIVTDGVFSMDGDLAPVAELADLARRHDAWLMTDDAHGLGVIGGGRGSSFAGGDRADVPLQMGTLSKAVGGYGGYLCASRPVVELMRNRARTFVYSTALPPASAAAALAALDLITGDPALVARPLAKARAFTRALNLPDAQSPIVPVIVGDASAALDASALLQDEGFLVVPIRPPTVPAGTARLRFAFTAGHPDEAIERIAALVREQVMAESR
ncbi:MAG: 8-amino-7-oxononanoate synthase [Xanthobacteraceae bacterium]|nr:8-amino-7-oxononanoate synthase [Xanthobacteraceae bacterium]